jgi:hypothetical protein
MASTDAKPVPQKNVAYRVTFPILDADGDLVTGATGLDSEISKDGGTFADCTNEATEIATSSGMYYLDLTSTEMNADTVAIIVKTTSSGAKTTPIVMYPEEAGDIRVNVTQIEGSDATDQINAACDTALADYDAPTSAELVSEINAVQSDIAALNNLSAAQVNAEVVDALATDTYAEPGQGAPAATTSLAAKINYLYKAFRNKVTQTSTTYSLFADDASTVDQKATVSDDGTTFTRGEITSGP